MKIVVLSDTHGNLKSTRKAAEKIEEIKPECIIHCGDIGTVQVVAALAPWRTHYVWGNNDPHWIPELDAAIEQAGGVSHGEFGSLELAGRRIAFLHGDDGRRLHESISGGEYHLVCSGHTHVAEHHRERETVVLNPGALYRAPEYTFAVVSLPDLVIELQTVDK